MENKASTFHIDNSSNTAETQHIYRNPTMIGHEQYWSLIIQNKAKLQWLVENCFVENAFKAFHFHIVKKVFEDSAKLNC